MQCWPFIWPFLGLSRVSKCTIRGSFSSEANVITIFHPVSQLQDWALAWFINMMQRPIKYSTLRSAGYTHGLHTSLIYLWMCFGKQISRMASTGFKKSNAANITYRDTQVCLFVISWFKEQADKNKVSSARKDGSVIQDLVAASLSVLGFFLSGHLSTGTRVPVDCLSLSRLRY